MNFKTGELSDTEYRYLRHKAKEINEKRELSFFKNPEALRASAEMCGDKPQISDEWTKLVWYGEACGGKVVRFRAGSPYLPKEGKRKGFDGKSEAEREAERLSNSLSRTKRRIFEIAACNSWQWFWTGTLDGEKCDRNDLNGTFKRLSQFLRDYRKGQSGDRLTYLIVPEQHKDGAWHFHGLFNGISEEELKKFTLDDYIPERIRKTIENGTDVFEWQAYSKRFGYTTLTEVKSHEAVSKYVTKYITKDMCQANVGSGRHLYYASQGLNKPVTLCEGHTVNGVPSVDYMNDYVGCRSVATADEMKAIAAQYFEREISVP